MKTTTLWGRKAHLILVEDDGTAYEVTRPFRLGNGTVEIDMDRVLQAVYALRDKEPLYREVQLEKKRTT